MARIDDVPGQVTHAGQAHDYTGPDLNTVTLVNAPVDATMKVGPHTPGPGVADAYITAEIDAGRAWQAPVTLNGPTAELRVPLTYNTATQYNYARITIGSRSWYMFITDTTAVNRTVTEYQLEIDPLSTYPDWRLGYSMVVQAHAAVAASQNDTFGDRYCEAPEPISAPPSVGVLTTTVLDTTPEDWTLLVISANDLRGRGTSTPYHERHVAEIDIQQMDRNAYLAGVGPTVDVPPDAVMPAGGGDHGFTQDRFAVDYPWESVGRIYVPTVQPSPVSTVDGVVQGGGAYLFTPSGFASWLTAMQSAPWVEEGIVSVRRVPKWALTGGGTTGGPSVGDEPPTSPDSAAWLAVALLPEYRANVTTGSWDATILANWRETYLSQMGAARFRKLATSAFTQIAVGTGESSTVYEPDLMRTAGINLHARTGTAHGEPSIRVTVDYNTLTDQLSSTIAAGGSDGIVATGYARAASNTASAVLGPSNSALTSLATRQAMEYNRELARATTEAQVPMTLGIIGAQSVMSAAGGAVLGSAGGPFGAVLGAAVGGGSAAVTAGLSANASLDIMDMNQAGAVDIGAYQLGANGVFNAISFRTWVQGLRAQSGRGQAAVLAAAWRQVTGQALRVSIIGPRPDQVRQLISRWERFGYMIGRAFKPSRLDVMTRFSYWRTEDATVTGRVPQADRDRIAAAFDRGITLYGSWSDIGQDVTAVNAPVDGFTY